MDSLKAKLLGMLVNLLVGMLTPELVKQFADQVLDFVENYVKGTASTVDDNIVLPVCQQIRIAFGIEDNDVQG